MKMNIVDRLLLTIYTLIIILISVAILGLFIAIGVGSVPLSEVEAFLSTINFSWQFFLATTLISILFLIVSIKLLLSGSRTKAPNSTLLKNTDLGMIRVSVNALEIMTQKAVRSFEEVKDARINIVPEEDGVKVQLKVLIMPDVVLPDLTSSIQQRVKDYIESYSGIIVKEVFIYIDNLSTPQQRPKVQ